MAGKAYICYKNTPLKRLGYITLLTLLILQAGGLLLVYKAQQWYASEQMADLMEDGGAFTELELTPSEYTRAKVGQHEIYYQGRMFDVRTVAFGANRITLRVMNDAGEDAALKKIKGLTSEKKNKDLLEQLMKLFAEAYTPVSVSSPIHFSSVIPPYYRTYKERPESLPLPTFYPPPRLS